MRISGIASMNIKYIFFSSPKSEENKETNSDNETKSVGEEETDLSYSKNKDSCRTRSLSSDFKQYLATQVIIKVYHC